MQPPATSELSEPRSADDDKLLADLTDFSVTIAGFLLFWGFFAIAIGIFLLWESPLYAVVGILLGSTLILGSFAVPEPFFDTSGE